ncbi:MAG: SDR family NAD(P)-dependent oxidoreductase [Halobacteriales archaeon]|nr:SDR family NAD(P)-dependent oxidoreductase [Halobacteriales archaeon]
MAQDRWRAPDLRGQVAVVTGATRGVGRGIADVLGQAGMTVYVTGRSTGTTRTEGLAGTVEDAAAGVTAAGGQGIGVVCDHTRDTDAEALFERVRREQGRLDLLVNNAWGGYEDYAYKTFADPFWQQPVERWRGMFDAGVRVHYTASRLAAPLLVARGRGLIVGTSAGDGLKFRGAVTYDVAKAAIERMMWGMARELRPHGVAALALQPGFTRTERVMAAFGGDEKDPRLAGTNSTWYVGRAVAMLAADPAVLELTGRTLMVGDLAERYGFTDVDGQRVPPFRLPAELA